MSDITAELVYCSTEDIDRLELVMMRIVFDVFV